MLGPRGLLVGRRADGVPPWGLIGGSCLDDEPPEIAAVREVAEETGLPVRVVAPEIGRRVHPLTGRSLIYVGCVPADATSPSPRDASLLDVRWVAPDFLPGLHEPVLMWIAEVQR